ncbi:MAG TPA: DUF4143 domain-containing protein [Polyangiaceae bacterium]|nr:DUF4143 domain-containing protein [Polyangiaceae bacterium]
MLSRPKVLASLGLAVERHRLTVLVGPKSCGKTALARAFATTRRATVFDLNDAWTLQGFERPGRMIERLRGLVVLDGVERQPELLAEVRRFVAERRRSATFLAVSGVSPGLLASDGDLMLDVPTVEVGGLEPGEADLSTDVLWVRGGLPPASLAQSDEASFAWRRGIVREFIERDFRRSGLLRASAAFERTLTMAAHGHGQAWNSSSIARALKVDDTTVHRYLEVLSGTFMLRVLPAWVENTRRRQRKAPKVYVRDSGILHALLGLETQEQLRSHPIAAASWKGFALERVLALLPTREVHHWALHTGAELDLLATCGGKRFGFVFQFADHPTWSPAMDIAVEVLRLDRLWVIFDGERSDDLGERIRRVPLLSLDEELAA